MNEPANQPPLAWGTSRFRGHSLWLSLALVALGLLIGAALYGVLSPSEQTDTHREHDAMAKHMGQPVPEAGPRQLAMTQAARMLAEVAVEPVARMHLWHEVRLDGKIAFNETLVTYLTAWVPGRIDDLYVDFTGVRVRQGDHMVKLYSPELISAQAELIRSWEALQEAQKRLETSSSEFLQGQVDDSQRNLESAREKLRLLGLTQEQIDE
ncbi:unnamed protein product, partial [marine sediment metagenome]